MSAPLIIAVPSKGRIQEECSTFFARSGVAISKGNARDYTGRLRGVANAEVLFLSASEIPTVLDSGQAHLGVTGEDVIRERTADPDATVSLLMPLGFGKADLVVAVPRAWIDVATMTDLEEVAGDIRARHHRHMRVATKYIRLTRQFFATHGLADYRIVESAGATEGAPASGQADIIVDITTTGATLAANNLKVLADGVILKSQAQLAASLSAEWSASARAALRHILDMVMASEGARTKVVLRFTGAGKIAPLAAKIAADLPRAELQPNLSGSEQVLYCESGDLYAAVALLRASGVSGSIRSAQADYIFAQDNVVLDGLLKRIDARR